MDVERCMPGGVCMRYHKVGLDERTHIGDESSNLLSVLDELNSDTLSDSGVGLFGFNTDLSKESVLLNDMLSLILHAVPPNSDLQADHCLAHPLAMSHLIRISHS
jgi:hypothetical protein